MASSVKSSSRPNRLLLGLLLCLALLASCRDGANIASRAPESAAGLARSGFVTGEEALREINNLHGKGIPALEGFIASYGPGREHGAAVTAWVSRASSNEEAARQERVMLELMRANPRSPFIEAEAPRAAGRKVAAWSGMGQTHLVFAAGELVYWIAVDPPLADRALADFLTLAP